MVLRRTHTKPLSDLIDEFLHEAGLDKKLKEREIIASWDQIVGGMIAHTTQSISIREGVMFVHIRSAVIKNELQMIRQGLIDEINRRAGYAIIQDLVIR